MLTDEVRAAYEVAVRDKDLALMHMMYPPVIATPARGGGKTATLMEIQERYHREEKEIMQRRRRMEAMQYMTWPAIECANEAAQPYVYGSPGYQSMPRTYTQEELDFRVKEAAARASQEAHARIGERIAEARIDAFYRGRNYVEPTPKAPLPIHNAMRATLRANEQYENKAFLPGGLLPLMHDA
jgi:hypothetical protein